MLPFLASQPVARLTSGFDCLEIRVWVPLTRCVLASAAPVALLEIRQRSGLESISLLVMRHRAAVNRSGEVRKLATASPTVTSVGLRWNKHVQSMTAAFAKFITMTVVKIDCENCNLQWLGETRAKQWSMGWPRRLHCSACPSAAGMSHVWPSRGPKPGMSAQIQL